MPQNAEEDSARSGRGRRSLASLEKFFARKVEESRSSRLDVSFSKLHISSNKRASSSSVTATSRPAAASSKPAAASSSRRASFSSRPAASSKPATASSRPSSSSRPASSSGSLAHELASKLRIRVKENERQGREQGENVDLENLETYVDVGSKENRPISDEEKKKFMSQPDGRSWYQVDGMNMSHKKKEKEAADAEDDEMKKKRKITNEICMKYIQTIIDSQGFDIGEELEVPTSPKIFSRVVPICGDDDVVEELVPGICCKALAKFNTLNKTRFRFKEVVKANTITGHGFLIFATFQAWMHSRSETFVTFQARGFHDFCYPERCRIHFCRLKKDASGSVEKMVDTKGDEWPVMG